MKTFIIAFTILLSTMLTACTADDKMIGGITYGTYGLANEHDMKNPEIQYELSGWSILWSVVFSETIVVPIYFIGWDLYRPIGKKDPNQVPGQVPSAK